MPATAMVAQALTSQTHPQGDPDPSDPSKVPKPTSASTMSSVSFNPHTTLGAYQIGVVVSYMLFGVTTTQTYIYYTRFPKDTRGLKALVAGVWVCAGAHALCNGYALYVYTISDHGHPERYFGAPVPRSLEIGIFIYGWVSFIVQGFFGFRIYAFSKKLPISVLVWAMAFLRLLSTVVVFIPESKKTSLPSFSARWEWEATSGWSIGTANDLLITATLVVLLHRKRKDVLKRTAVLMDKLILWTLETGLLTSVTGVIALACFVSMKHNLIFLGFFSLEAQMYSNSLLASINSRETLRAINDREISLALPTQIFSTIVFAEPVKMEAAVTRL
ncbi:hypothetical protein MVEN_01383800 [Mycena venus]|uniref:DUF6534 domain-containing protein n=1 Tax=Mycena venus TaxID=2733690 RepID=A0A8H7CSG3_9AGAR|nr:hypothetical protein MVEN_01383800 [Mycena venus]